MYNIYNIIYSIYILSFLFLYILILFFGVTFLFLLKPFLFLFFLNARGVIPHPEQQSAPRKAKKGPRLHCREGMARWVA